MVRNIRNVPVPVYKMDIIFARLHDDWTALPLQPASRAEKCQLTGGAVQVKQFFKRVKGIVGQTKIRLLFELT